MNPVLLFFPLYFLPSKETLRTVLLFGTGLMYHFATKNTVSWLFFVLYLVIGILNIILVHFVPGILYIIFSLLFVPAANKFFKQKLNFSISLKAKIIIALLILWPTLAVGDLAEIFGL